MAADEDYIIVTKPPHCKKVALPPKTATKKTDTYEIVAKVYVTAKVCIRLIYICPLTFITKALHLVTTAS